MTRIGDIRTSLQRLNAAAMRRSAWLMRLYFLLPVGAMAAAVARHGLQTAGAADHAAHLIQTLLLGAHCAMAFIAHHKGWHRWFELGDRRALLPATALTAICSILSLAPSMAPLRNLADIAAFLLAAQAALTACALAARRLASTGSMLLTFILIPAILGACALRMPGAWSVPRGFDWSDAIFTAVAAVCGTGLEVRDIARELTPFGHAVILMLMLAGAFAMIVFGTVLAFIASRPVADRQSPSMKKLLGSSADDAILHLPSVIRLAAGMMLIMLLLGTLALLPMADPRHDAPHQLLTAGFMAVSALSNTGFSIAGPISPTAALTHLVLVPLVVLGSLGLPVLANLLDVTRAAFRPPVRTDRRAALRQLSLQTKLVLISTLSIYLLGTASLFITQRIQPPPPKANPDVSAHASASHGTLRSLATASLYASTRTSGFGPVTGSQLTPASQFLVMPLMLIGGAPGSPAGGAKTLTVAILFLAIIATLRGNRALEAFGRTIPEEIVRLAGAIMVLSFGLASISALCLFATETQPFDQLLFEATSAAANSGISSGVAPFLSSAGRLVLVLTMIAGCVGPLWLIGLAWGGKKRPISYQYPEEQVLLG